MRDQLFRLGYSAAYRVMRAYWAVRHPTTHGSLVALWHEGSILLIRNSYHCYYSLPGGYVHHGETSRQAALRELAEEVGLVVDDSELELALDLTHEWEGKHEHVEIFQITLERQPQIEVDRREVIAAKFFAPDEALRLDLFPPIRRLIHERRTRQIEPNQGSGVRT